MYRIIAISTALVAVLLFISVGCGKNAPRSESTADSVAQAESDPVYVIEEPPRSFSENQSSLHELTMFRGNPERNLAGVGTVPRRPKLLWRFQTRVKYEGPYEQRGDPKLTESGQWKGLGWTGQPVMKGDYVYFGSGDSYVYCIDWFFGRLAWYYPNHHCVKGSISIFDNRIYHGGRDNKIHCYSLDGQMIWETRTGNDMDSNPVVVDGRGYIGGEDHNIYCFDPETGEINWQTPIEGSMESSPCVAEGRVYGGTSRGYLYCCDWETGEKIWEFRTLGDTDSTPVWWDGRIYVGCATGNEAETGHFWCIDAVTGEKIWHIPTSRGIWATPAINPDRGAVYIGASNGFIYALRMEDGSLLWKRDLYSRIWSSPVVVDGCVLVGVRDGRFWNLDEITGEPIWVFDDLFDIDATPCVANGVIVIGSQNGWVYCIGEAREEEEVDTRWFCMDFPMSGRLYRDAGASESFTTIENPAPPPQIYTDTNAANRDHYLEPVYGSGWE